MCVVVQCDINTQWKLTKCSVVISVLICSNIPTAPAYEVYISQLIKYSRACGSFNDFLHRGLLTRKLLD